MADFRFDQAAGLRRLFGGGCLQVIAFTAGSAGIGRSLTVVNIAAALARQGKRVLILDENAGEDDCAAQLGLARRYDLMDVIEGRRTMSETLLRPQESVFILPAAVAVRHLAMLGRQQQAVFTGAMRHLESQVDLILVDAALGPALEFSPLVLAAHEVVMMVSASSTAITEAYLRVKRLSQQHARRDFRILVSKVRDAAEARAIAENMAAVARQRQLGRLEYAGSIPLDDALRQAHLNGTSVVELMPASTAALACQEIAVDLPYWRQMEREGTEASGDFFQQLLHLSQRIMPTALPAG